MEKHYRAIAHGSFSKDEGMIDAPIGRHPIDRKKWRLCQMESHPEQRGAFLSI